MRLLNCLLGLRVVYMTFALEDDTIDVRVSRRMGGWMDVGLKARVVSSWRSSFVEGKLRTSS